MIIPTGIPAEEPSVEVSVSDIYNNANTLAWNHICNKYHVNEWSINDGTVNLSDTIIISVEDAVFLGLA